MLSAALYAAALPCRDLARAKRFYADKLGLTPADEQPGRLFYSGRGGTGFLLIESKDSEGNLLAVVELRVGAIDRPDP